MNKMKILAFSLALLMILTAFASCSEKPVVDPTQDSTAPKQTETTAPSTVNTTVPSITETEDTAPAETVAKIAIDSKEAFLAAAEELLDLSLYRELSIFEDSAKHQSYTYEMKIGIEQLYDLDYAVTLGDGSSFTMPISYGELAQKGWRFQFDVSEKNLKAGYCVHSVPLLSKSGKKILVDLLNQTNETIAYKDAVVIVVASKQYDEFSPNQKYEDAIGFTICDSLTNLSSLGEIIQRLGNPTSLKATIRNDDNGAYRFTIIEIVYNQPHSVNNLKFILSGDDDYILSMSYGPQTG